MCVLIPYWSNGRKDQKTNSLASQVHKGSKMLNFAERTKVLKGVLRTRRFPAPLEQNERILSNNNYIRRIK